jgi:hypothetical protein
MLLPILAALLGTAAVAYMIKQVLDKYAPIPEKKPETPAVKPEEERVGPSTRTGEYLSPAGNYELIRRAYEAFPDDVPGREAYIKKGGGAPLAPQEAAPEVAPLKQSATDAAGSLAQVASAAAAAAQAMLSIPSVQQTMAVPAANGAGPQSYHALDITTDKGSFRASVSPDTMDALQSSALASKLSRTGERPSWWS